MLPIIRGHYTCGTNQQTLAHNPGVCIMKVAMFVEYVNVKDLIAS